MCRLLSIFLAAACIAGGGPAVAQVTPPIPEVQNPIPAPLPPPPTRPIIDGPLTQSPPLGVVVPPPLNT
jgi:hypothetical protein